MSVTFVARCHEDGAPLATGDLASAGLCGISSAASLKILKASEVEAEGGTLAIAILTHVDLDPFWLAHLAFQISMGLALVASFLFA